jgi:hypothetical protein
VLLAEAAETRLADPAERREWHLMPVRMKLRTLLYGKSPGDEFTWMASAVSNVRAGDMFYIEASSSEDFRFKICGISGKYYESSHAPRVKYFREFSAGEHQESSFRLNVNDSSYERLRGVAVVLTGSSGSHKVETDARGQAEWKALPPGRYDISLAKSDYSVSDPQEALSAVEVPLGGCPNRFARMEPRFALKGIVRTPDGRPAQGVNLRIELLTESTSAHTTTDSEGHFKFSRVAPGAYTLLAGDDKNTRSPFPTTYYPGVPNRELSQRLTVGPDQPESLLQFTVPPPVPTRTLVLKIESPTTSIYPRIHAQAGTIYDQEWSAKDTSITATVSAGGPLSITVVSLTQQDWIASPELTIPPGTTPIQSTVQLNPKSPDRSLGPK